MAVVFYVGGKNAGNFHYPRTDPPRNGVRPFGGSRRHCVKRTCCDAGEELPFLVTACPLSVRVFVCVCRVCVCLSCVPFGGGGQHGFKRACCSEDEGLPWFWGSVSAHVCRGMCVFVCVCLYCAQAWEKCNAHVVT